MHLFFIRNIPVEISTNHKLWNQNEMFDYLLEDLCNIKKFINIQGTIIIKVNRLNFLNWIKIIMLKGGTRIDKIIFLVNDLNDIKSLIHAKNIQINAAGGIVVKNNHILMVFRSGKWELPKGKLEKNETYEHAAVREILEECNIYTQIIDEVCSSLYTYLVRGKVFFKNVVWFNMICLNDENMKPQLEEGITKVKWISFIDLKKILSQSYLSIGHAIETYFNKANIQYGRT